MAIVEGSEYTPVDLVYNIFAMKSRMMAVNPKIPSNTLATSGSTDRRGKQGLLVDIPVLSQP